MKKSVVISCAGNGSRLGKNIPKCLVEIDGKSIIEYQLEQLQTVDDVIVVVGYKAEDVIAKVRQINPNVKFVYNLDYEHTATGASFIIGSKVAQHDFVIALDGDLLVHPNDMAYVLTLEEEFVCGEQVSTEEPMYMHVNEQGQAIDFSREPGQLEWSGLAGIYKKNIQENKWYVCDIMKEILLAKTVVIRAREIDTPQDYDEATRWLKNHYDDEKIIDSFFRKRFVIDDNYITSRYSLNNRDEYDIDFISRYISLTSTILDLGCGTGILEKELAHLARSILAIDKYQEFLGKAYQAPNVQYMVGDITTMEIQEQFDLVLLFGITMYLTDEEIERLLEKVLRLMHQNSIFIIKNQWGIQEEVIVNHYSEQLDSIYYAKYRKLSEMCKLLRQKGFDYEIHDIYPKNLNKWDNTHEYALVLKKRKINEN